MDCIREMEMVGMRVAIEHEQHEGWHVKDISAENHGFDLRSILFDDEGGLTDIRYIEVKARAQTGAIRLTSNEWKKSRCYGDQYWLYVVTYAGTDNPQLHRIQNPESLFHMEEDIFATGYQIPEENWRV